MSRRSKVHNEMTKLRASALNTLGIAFLVGSFVGPLMKSNGEALSIFGDVDWYYTVLGLLLHVVAALQFLSLAEE